MSERGHAPSAPTLVVIGNFDGVHVGHQAVLSAVSRLAQARSLRPMMLTFEPHPAVTLGRGAPALLTRLERKIELAQRSCRGLEVAVERFTADFARQSPEQFVRNVLLDGLHAAVVMVGVNFRFGHSRSGSFADLERFGLDLGFEAVAQPLVTDSEGPWSSSRIRKVVAAGDLERTNEMLGRPHMVSGVVAHGDARGRQLGFPTCNLAEPAEQLPAFGVYAVLVDRCEPDGSNPRALAKGVANIGTRPTVDSAAAQPLAEAFLFDFDGDLYDSWLRVHLVARLREEVRFDGLEALVQQMNLDCEQARELLASWEPDPEAAGAWV